MSKSDIGVREANVVIWSDPYAGSPDLLRNFLVTSQLCSIYSKPTRRTQITYDFTLTNMTRQSFLILLQSTARSVTKRSACYRVARSKARRIALLRIVRRP